VTWTSHIEWVKPEHQLEIMHQFVHVDYDWTGAPTTREEALETGAYDPTHCTITGVKQFGDDMFVTSPRWLSGVPASLNKVVRDPKQGGKSVLQPFPNWAMQTLGDPDSLQYIQSMEIDRRGWMWIIDVGRVNLFEPDAAEHHGPPKLWVWDIAANKKVQEYVFPDSVASHRTSFLNDIFVDDVRNVAYISDTSGSGGLVVYDFGRNRARRWDSHPSLSFEAPLPAFVVEGLDINVLGPLPVDGLALAPKLDRVFYTPIHGLHLYR
jgi:hypothetical protein